MGYIANTTIAERFRYDKERERLRLQGTKEEWYASPTNPALVAKKEAPKEPEKPFLRKRRINW